MDTVDTETVYSRAKNIIRNKEGKFIILKGSIN